jgi:hypothetical protein
LLIFLFFTCQLTVAQNKHFFENGLFKRNIDTSARTYSELRPYYISVIKGTLPESTKIVRRLNDSVAIIRVNNVTAFNLLSQYIKMAAASDNWKLSPVLEKSLTTIKNKADKFILSGLDIDRLLTVLKSRYKEVAIFSVNRLSSSVIILCKAEYLKHNLLNLKEIIFIDAYSEPHPEINIIGYDRSFNEINAVDYAIPGANGKNIVVGIKEQKPEDADLDLWRRVLPSAIAAENVSNHATVIASIIGGAGNSFYDGRGIAYGSKFFPSSFSNLFADDTAILHEKKVSVQNHSYGTVIQQFYGAEAVSYDRHTWLDKNFVHVFSAGNEGDSAATDGKYADIPGFANLTGNFKMAKNIISVGAIDNKGNVPTQSSAGPLYDGRLAPQLIALGPNGTSDAAAVVSGTIAVMQQVFADSNNQTLPPASLIKAILYNTTDDIYTRGIDYKTGYGLLNSYAAIKSIQQKKYYDGSITENQGWSKDIIIPANAAKLKITLAWTDSAAPVNNNKAIINDLDLEVQNTNNGMIYQPWVLNSSANVDSLIQPPTRKRDSLNTAEQVTVQLPDPGTYQIRVTGKDISSALMPFHIAFNIDTLNTFFFTNPQHTSDVNRSENENLIIKWKTFVGDTNQTGKLYVSYNDGIGWELLQSLIVNTNQYTWKIKDTNSVAMFKMETSFGTFFSKEFILSKVIQLRVDFLCADSFQLSWDKHVYANAYKLYSLTDSPYLKPIFTTNDTFKVLKRNEYPSLVYAVEPMLSNDVSAARSVALNIELQGVNCFYKTLNYDLLDDNNLNLVLELSDASYVDSIYFEKVSQSGQLQQTYGNTKVNTGNLIYTQPVSNLSNGLTYLRGRIQLKNGTIVYTDIISILTSGPHPILFYPNPVNAGTRLNYILKQGIAADSHLQLFDFTGRLIKDFASLPVTINIAEFPSGFLIYKLISQEGVVLDTGKLVIIKK